MRRLGASALVFLLAAPLAARDPDVSGKYMPPPGRVILVVGQDVPNIDDYLGYVPIEPAGFAAYTSIEGVDGLAFPVDQGGGIQHAQSLLDRHPNAVLQLAIYMVDSLEKVVAGDLDPEIDRLADWVKAAGRPVYLRPGYEFDFPDNGYKPEQFVPAYRRIVDRFREKGVDNVAWVWHSYASLVQRPHEDWYPGDDYVDWVAISYFEQPEDLMAPVADLAKRRGKPLMIAEACPLRLSTRIDDRAWLQWFRPMFAFARKHDVKMLSYINCDWDAIPLFESLGWGDTRVQSNENLRKRWMQEISRDVYLKGEPGLFAALGYEQNEKGKP